MALTGLGRRLYAEPYLLLTVTPMIWAGNAISGRVLVGEMSPMTTNFLRWLLALAMIVAIAWPEIVRERQALIQNWGKLLAFGTIGFTGFNAPLYLAAETTTAVNMGMIQAIMPALVLFGSYVAYRTPITPLQIVGLILGLVGVSIIVTKADPDVLHHLEVTPGDIWVLVASVFYSAYTVALRRRPTLPPLAFFAGTFAAATLSAAPLAGYELITGTIIWPGVKGWIVLIFLAIFPSILSQLFFMRGVELVGPGRAGLFVNLVPVFTAFAGVVLLGEPFKPYHAVALTIVLSGIGLAELGRPKPAPPPRT